MKKIFIINIITVIVLLLTIEGILRMFGNLTPLGLSEGVINNKSYEPNFNNKNVRNLKVFGKKVYTDSEGFRISGKKTNYQDRNKIIYFVGGSVTFGSGVIYEDTFVGILNSKSNNVFHINSGVIGSNIKNNYFILKNKIIDKNFEKIYVNFSLDDLIMTSLINDEKADRRNNLTILEKLKKIELFVWLNNFLRSKSVTYVYIKGFALNVPKSYYLQTIRYYKLKKNVEFMKEYLDKIEKINSKNDNKIIFLLIPYSHQINNENCLIDDFAENIIKNELNSRNLKYINFKTIFCKNESKKKIFFTNDPSHLSPYGNDVVARHLSDINR